MRKSIAITTLITALFGAKAFADEMKLNCYKLENGKETTWTHSLLGDCIQFEKDEIVITRFCVPGENETRISTKDARCHVKSNGHR